MNNLTALDLESYVAGGLLALASDQVPALPDTITDHGADYRYVHPAHPNLVLIERRTGDNFNRCSHYVVRETEHMRGIWRMTVDTIWDVQAIERLGINGSDALQFLERIRVAAYRRGRVIKLPSVPGKEGKVRSFAFSDNTMERTMSRIVSEQSVKLHDGLVPDGKPSRTEEICEIVIQAFSF